MIQGPGPIVMRCIAGEAEGPVPRGDAGRTGDGIGPAPRVVIVEDEAIVAWSLETTVEDMGYAVVATFADGESVLAGLAGLPAELALMDINLGPGIDGVETARRIRAEYGMRVIFISAYADPATRARIAETVPGAPLLRKPVQPEVLEATLRTVLDPPN